MSNVTQFPSEHRVTRAEIFDAVADLLAAAEHASELISLACQQRPGGINVDAVFFWHMKSARMQRPSAAGTTATISTGDPLQSPSEVMPHERINQGGDGRHDHGDLPNSPG